MGARTDPATGRVAHAPIRTCVGCRRPRAQSSLLRLVVRDGAVVVDRAAPGRGAYVCPEAACAEQALRRGGAPLRRALRAQRDVVVDGEELRARVRDVEEHGERRRQGVST